MQQPALTIHQFIAGIQPQLAAPAIAAIADCFAYQQYAKGEVLIASGQIAPVYVLVEQGLVRAYTVNTEGEDVTTGIYSAGQVACELSSFFRRIPSREQFVCLCSTSAWVISFDRLQQAFHSQPEFREFGRAVLVSEYAALKERMLSGLHLTAEERYAQLIKQSPEVFLHLPLKHVASYLGITDTSLSRIRKEFAKK